MEEEDLFNKRINKDGKNSRNIMIQHNKNLGINKKIKIKNYLSVSKEKKIISKII